jgi:hypothetical protein
MSKEADEFLREPPTTAPGERARVCLRVLQLIGIIALYTRT